MKLYRPSIKRYPNIFWWVCEEHSLAHQFFKTIEDEAHNIRLDFLKFREEENTKDRYLSAIKRFYEDKEIGKWNKEEIKDVFCLLLDVERFENGIDSIRDLIGD
jgi:hypothetical protein